MIVNNAAIHYDTWQDATDPDLAVVHEALDTNVFGAWQVVLGLLARYLAAVHKSWLPGSAHGCPSPSDTR